MAAPPRVAGYRVVRPLGEGAMGQVWVVEPAAAPGARRALKLLPAVDDPTLRARFAREAALLARVEGHPNLARVHDAGQAEDGRAWLVTELVEGEDLARRLARAGRLPWREAVGLAAQVARGLAHVHRHGVIHRDVKPSNIVVAGDGRAVLVDFGVAWADDDLGALTRTGIVVGTPAYFSPEQARGEPLDARSDVHALGATLFELLTGEVPFAEGPSPADTLQRILTRPAPAPSARAPGVPAAVDAVVARALAKDRGTRPPDADALADALEACLTPEAPPPPAAGPRGALLGVALGGAAGALVVAVVGLLVARPATPDGPPPAAPPALAGPGAPAPTPPPGPPGPSPRTPPGPGDALDGAAAVAALLERGEVREALGRLRRWRGPTLGDEAARVEEAARRQALAAPDAARQREALAALARARALSPSPSPGGGEVADAVLRRVAAGCTAPAGAGPDRALEAEVVGLLEDLADTGLRPADRDAAERAVDDVYAAHARGALRGDAYARALAAAVVLDIDLQSDHIRSFLPPPDARGWAVELLAARSRLYDATGRLNVEGQQAAGAALRAVLDGPAPLGPVTRARATCIVAGLVPAEAASGWTARLERARRDDPRSPYVALALALRLAGAGRDAEAHATAREAVAAMERGGYGERISVRGYERLAFYERVVRLLARLGHLDEARATIEVMRRFEPTPREAILDLEAMVARRAEGGE